MVTQCTSCQTARAAVKRPKTGAAVCKQCFFRQFEDEVHSTITSNALFRRGDRVAIGASGGKDSTVLAYILSLLNDRYSYGLDLFLLSIDEGISGYRDDSLATVHRNKVQYGLPLLVLSYTDLYGWSMDEIVRLTGRKSNCTYCGVFRRQALDRGAVRLNADKVATGHNADDIAETVLLNFLRGDYPRLSRCIDAVTGRDSALPRVKPFKYTYEKEIVLYARFKRLDYFATECTYAPHAYRGHARQLVKDLENVRPSAIVDIIRAAEQFNFPENDDGSQEGDADGDEGSDTTAASTRGRGKAMPVQRKCERCGYISSQRLCKACLLLDSLKERKHAVGGNVEPKDSEVHSVCDTTSAHSRPCS